MAQAQLLLAFYYNSYTTITSDVFVSDKKTIVLQIYIYLFFQKLVWVICFLKKILYIYF